MRIMFSFVRFLTTLDKTISWQSVQYNEYDTKANLARESATQFYFYSLWINKKAMKEKNKDRNSISMRILKSFAAEYDFKFIVLVSSWESNGNQTFRMERQLASAAASHVAITSAKKGDLTWCILFETPDFPNPLIGGWDTILDLHLGSRGATKHLRY